MPSCPRSRSLEYPARTAHCALCTGTHRKYGHTVGHESHLPCRTCQTLTLSEFVPAGSGAVTCEDAWEGTRLPPLASGASTLSLRVPALSSMLLSCRRGADAR